MYLFMNIFISHSHEIGAMYNVNTNGMHGMVKTANDYVNI